MLEIELLPVFWDRSFADRALMRLSQTAPIYMILYNNTRLFCFFAGIFGSMQDPKQLALNVYDVGQSDAVDGQSRICAGPISRSGHLPLDWDVFFHPNAECRRRGL